MVLIKDLEMPESCYGCRFKSLDVYGHKICDLTYRQITVPSGRPDWCPLTEVEPYGVEGLLYKEKS